MHLEFYHDGVRVCVLFVLCLIPFCHWSSLTVVASYMTLSVDPDPRVLTSQELVEVSRSARG